MRFRQMSGICTLEKDANFRDGARLVEYTRMEAHKRVKKGGGRMRKFRADARGIPKFLIYGSCRSFSAGIIRWLRAFLKKF